MLCLLSSFALIALTIAKPSPAGLTFEVQRNVHARPRPYLRLASALGLQQPVYSHNYISYGLSFAVGSPAKIYHTVLDTGSSLTFFGPNTKQPFIRTRTTQPTPVLFSETFASDGDVHGTMVYDQVTLAGKTFKGCFGISELEPKFVELDRDVYGITALGVQLMQNQTLQAPTHYVPTFLQSMRDAGVIQHAIVSLNFASPPSIKSVDALAGSVTIGAIDTSKIKGAITWSNRQNVDGQAFWAIKVGFPTLGVRNAVSLIDSGTTMVALEEAAFDRYFAALKPRGATYDDTLGVVQMPKGVVPDTLPFVLSGRTFVLTGQQQLVGSEMYGLLGLDTTKHYSWITKGSTVSVLGLHLIEKFSVIFDEEHHQIGFAERA